MKLFLSLLAALVVLSLVATRPARADEKIAPEFTFVRGVITAIDGNNISVGDAKVVMDDNTEVVPGGKDALKVGANITARIKAGTVVRIEIHAPKPPAASGGSDRK